MKRGIIVIAFLITVCAGYSQERSRTIEELTRLIEKNPQDSSLYKERADVYGRQEKYVMALEDLNRAIMIKPNATLFATRGMAYFYMNMFQDSIDDYTRAITLSPKHAAYYGNRSMIYLFAGDYQKAIDDCNTELHIGSTDEALTYYWRGFAFLLLGEHQNAISDLNRAISLKQDYAEAYEARAKAYLQINKQKEAIDDLTKVIQLAPDANIYRGRAKAYQALVDQTTDKKQKADYQKKADADFAMVEKLEGSR